jgi:hypothetical protein
MSHEHHHEQHLPGPERFNVATASVLSKGLLIIAIVALSLTAWGGMRHPQQFAFSWLFAFFYFYTIAAGCLFWTLVHHAVDADWSVVVRRQLENVAGLFWIIPFLFLPLLAVKTELWHWMDPAVAANDPLLPDKAGYLNMPFFLVRMCFYFGFFFFASRIFKRYSCRQDANGCAVYSWRMRCMSYGFIPLFAVSISFSAIDWLMGLDHHWYSTMWGVYIFAGTAQSSMATLILITMTLKQLGYYKGALSKEHDHIMGKLLFAFTVFWAYIAFSQYMLIWYANIPEETTFFLQRNVGTWWYASVFLVAGHFVVPLLMHAFDHHWIILPKVHPQGFAVHWLTVTSWVGIGSLLGFAFLQTLGKNLLFPAKDPRLADCVKLTN